MVGTHLGCLSSARKDHDVFDFTTKSGVSIEVKTTTHQVKSGSGSTYYRWHISDQRSALEGRKPLADRWIFLVATFPESASASRTFNAFDPRYWIAYLATGEQVRSTRCKSFISESAIKRLGLTSFPLSELKQKFARSIEQSFNLNNPPIEQL